MSSTNKIVLPNEEEYLKRADRLRSIIEDFIKNGVFEFNTQEETLDGAAGYPTTKSLTVKIRVLA